MGSTIEYGPITFGSDEPAVWDDELGSIYVIEFDSRWIKVGRSRRFKRRLSDHRREFKRYHDWTVVRSWSSDLIPNVKIDSEAFCSPLVEVELDLLREARRRSPMALSSTRPYAVAGVIAKAR